MSSRRRAGLRGLVLALGLALAGPATAQGLNLGATGDDEPVTIEADDGIEWQQSEQVYIARGNARAVKGKVTLLGDALYARYRPAADGSTEIWRIEARGNVRISSPSEVATGDQGVYDLDSAVLVLTGSVVRFETAEQRITAHQSLEYWQQKQLAVARGDAVAVQGDKELRADVLSAHLKESETGSLNVYRVEAFGNVRVTTATEVVLADYGDYDVESGIARLEGSVKITRGGSQLNGDIAEVDLNKGISRLLSAPGAKTRVRGLLVPKKSDGEAKE